MVSILRQSHSLAQCVLEHGCPPVEASPLLESLLCISLGCESSCFCHFFEPFSPLTSFAVLKVKRARDCGSVFLVLSVSINLRMQHLSLSLADWLLRAVGFAASPLSHGGWSYEVFLLVAVMF